ncbi:hypothetical protein [Candidatus Leptofilum sp.]|uniref:hypothetical protein n=1 Tax=Candidatus Leptofilum sp. TaxID=3241576 RepID=UPI003B59572B
MTQDSSSKVTDQQYKDMLQALKDLGDSSKLADSPLISSCLVENHTKENPHIFSSEALRNVLTELLNLLGVGSKNHANLLHTRFWKGKELTEIWDSETHNPKMLAYRTIQLHQRTGIHKLAAWFQEKETACQQHASSLDTSSKRRNEEIGASELVENASEFVYTQPTFLTKIIEDFHQTTIGQTPESWGAYGGANITPTVQAIEEKRPTKHGLSFPSIANQQVNKDLIYKPVQVSAPYEIKTQLTFQNEPADRAGIVIGWQNRSQLIRIQANLYWNHLSYWEKVSNLPMQRHMVQIPDVIEVGTPYWLTMQADIDKSQKRFVIVSWATSEQDFVPILAIQNVQHPLTGYVGLSTSGPNLPYVHFHTFQIAT